MANETSNSTLLDLAIYSYPERLVAASILSLVLITGTFGNIMIIIAVMLSKKLQTCTNTFVVSLSIADTLTCLAIFPTICALVGKNGWPFPGHEWLCTIGAYLLYTCVGVGIFHLAAIAVNRIVLIVYPSTYLKMYTPWKLAVQIFILWVIPALVMLVPPLLNFGGLGYDYEDTTCSDIDLHPKGKLYNLIQAACLYPGPLIIVIVCYSRTFWHIKMHFKRKRRHLSMLSIAEASTFTISDYVRSTDNSCEILEHLSNRRLKLQEVQITKNLFFVVLAFALFFSPYFISLFVPPFRRAALFTGAITGANSAVNPLIYALKHPHFKIVLKLIFKCRYGDIPEPSRLLSRFKD